MPEGTGQILNARSLPSAYRRLAEILQPGLVALDVGCGTGTHAALLAELGYPVGDGAVDEATAQIANAG